jgi:hypothetical protein
MPKFYPCWIRQTQARLNQPWARLSDIVPLPAGQNKWDYVPAQILMLCDRPLEVFNTSMLLTPLPDSALRQKPKSCAGCQVPSSSQEALPSSWHTSLNNINTHLRGKTRYADWSKLPGHVLQEMRWGEQAPVQRPGLQP